MSTSVGSESEAQIVGKPDGPPVVRVSQPVQAPLTHVWEVLVSPVGSQALLGEGAVLGAKGEPYHCTDGVSGVVRSYHPLEQLRVSWHERADAPASLVEIDVRADGEGAVLDLLHNHLPEGADVESLQARWSGALSDVAAAAER